MQAVVSIRNVALALCAPLLAVAPGFAQEAPGTFEFSFSNPGARSMGLGGAFVALADDATAAFANPAGLVQLLRPEVSLEVRHWGFSTPYTAGGRASGAPTGYGIDVEPGIRTSTSKEDTTGVSFASFVYPKNRWSLALYRHQLTTYRLNNVINGLFAAGNPPDGVVRFLDQRLATELDIVSYGLAGAWRASESLSFGVGISYFEGSVSSDTLAFAVDEFPATYFEANTFRDDRLYVASAFDVDASDLGFSAGFLWSVAESWKVGGVFRQGPEFPYRLVNRAGPASGLPVGTVIASVTGRSIAFPDVYGLGVAYRSAGGSVTVGLEWDRVEYSSIVESLESPLSDIAHVAMDDADELHIGVEYVILDSTPLIAIRLGGWRDPDHQVRYLGDDPFARAIYPPGEDALHGALGFGIAFERFQLDLGVDFSTRVDTAAVSAIYSF